MLLGHGNDVHHQLFDIKTDFSSNVLPMGMPEKIKEHIKNNLHLLDNYPLADAAKAAKAIANHHNLDASQIIATNGSTEAFYLIAQKFKQSSSLILTPSFSEYEDASLSHKLSVSFLPAKKLKTKLNYKYSTVWLANPNNPDGFCFSTSFIEKLCNKNPDTYFILDESYINICSCAQTLINTYMPNNLIVVRSLTKDFCQPGLRAGYMVATSEVIDSINHFRMPWSVNALAQEAIYYIMSNYHSLLPNAAPILKESKRVQAELASLPEIEITNSDCNYFLAKTKVSSAKELKTYLLKSHGFLIRDASNFRSLNKQHFRIAVQNQEANNDLITAIKTWISQNK